jgi:hypothetical protein
MAENTAKATPARVLFLFALLFAGVAAALWRGEMLRSETNAITYPTALGDQALAPISLLESGATFTAQLDDQSSPTPFRVVSKSGQSKREERLWKVGVTEAPAFFIYRSDVTNDYWIKSAAGGYYRVQPAP